MWSESRKDDILVVFVYVGEIQDILTSQCLAADIKEHHSSL